ncbi:glycerophosphodiester phosphodiesterase family protein [Butyrivibrio sp. AE3004]|uniref:glycerophosphodiester phosphodiesterase family protein n=1 Tax=Butyrivibrio sp. AE3004 TaxID=1506994 RepID=UPI0004941355|nr:glycerophosphodiester phosphodiesterase family protein [Butyrivibrio sp. AE3004]
MKAQKYFYLIMISLFIFLIGCTNSNDLSKIEAMRDFFSETKYIIHACGIISDSEGNEYDYTNSREALENSYAKGNRIIEADFHYTSDHVLVCGHAWGDLYLEGKQLTPGEAPNYSDFLKCKVQDKFSVLTFDDIAKFMRQHEDLILVTDTKETDIDTYKKIAADYPDLKERFVVQIYHAKEFEKVRKVGFPYIIYTLYETEDFERTKKALLSAGKMPILGFTFHDSLTNDEEFMKTMKETGLPLFIHTINDDKEMENYLQKGISGIYTDRVDKADSK